VERIKVTKIRTDANAPWKKRFLAPSISYSKVACNAPGRGIVITNRDGHDQVYAWDVSTGVLEKRSDCPEGLLYGAYISPDGRFIYYLDLDEQTDQAGHLVRIPCQGGEPQDIAPALPPYNTGYRSVQKGIALCSAGNRAAFTAGMEDGFRVYVIEYDHDGNFSVPREILYSKPLITFPILSYSGDVFVIGSAERSQGRQLSLLAFNADTGQKIGELWEGDDCSVTPLFFSPVKGDTRLTAITNRGGIERLVIWNPLTGERIDPALDDIQGSLQAFDWSADGKRILFCTFNAAVQQLYVYEVEEDRGYQLNPPPGTSYSAYFNPAGDIHSHLTTATEPVRLVLLDGQNGSLKETILDAGEVPSGKPWSSVIFPSSDGQEIQGWVSVPDGDGPFPLILHADGGPGDVQLDGFSPEAQAWLDHGFARVVINYRGSTTFGKDFEEQIWGNPGDLEVEDMVAARQYLVNKGITDPKKIFLTGWSYGGYLTLQALGKYPDLWAGGVGGIALVDWAMMYEDGDEWLRQRIRSLLYGTPEEKPEQYAKSSPTTYIQHVKAPILIIQGRKDTGAPARPIEIYEQKMKALGKEIEVHWFDAGHLGPLQTERAIKLQEKMMEFAYNILEKLER